MKTLSLIALLLISTQAIRISEHWDPEALAEVKADIELTAEQKQMV